jgi:hypothetical protein
MGVPFLKLSVLCGVGAALLFAMAGCRGGGGTGGSSNPVATVGKDAVTEKEFFSYLQQKSTVKAERAVPGQPNTVVIADTFGFQALTDLIVNKIVLQLAKDQDVYPTDKQVNDEVDFERSQSPHLIEDGMQHGLSLDDLKEDFKLQLARYNLQVKGVTETEQDAKDYIKTNPKQFMDPPLVQAMMMVVKKADKAAVDSALMGGAPFETVAKQYTLDKNGEGNGYRYSPKDSNLNHFPKPIQDLFNKTPESRTTDWLAYDKAGTAFIKFYIIKKVEPKPMAQTPVLVEKLRRFLAQQKGQKAGIEVNREIAQRIQKTKGDIKISLKQYQTPWNLFVTKLSDDLARAPQAQGIGSSATGAAPAAPGTSSGTAPAAPTNSKK